MLQGKTERKGTKEAIEVLFNPKNIAYIGASSAPEKMSGQAIRNIYRSDYKGTIYAVNKKGEVIEGHQSYQTIADLPEDIDLAFITLGASHNPDTIRELAQKNVKVAIVAAAGFSELGSEKGKNLMEDLGNASLETGIRLVGPISNGIYSTSNNLVVGYNEVHTRKLSVGSIGLVSHSGAMLTNFVDAIEAYGAGLSRFVSCGGEIDMSMSDYIEYLVEDDQTSVIALIVDSVGDGARFRNALRKARKCGKRVVALKLGDSALGKQATLAHSSHLAGGKEAYEAVLAAEGVIKVPTAEVLAAVCAILSSGREAQTNSVTACSPSGGDAIMLADRLAEANLTVDKLSPETVEEISHHLLYDSATIINPFDLGLGGRDHYKANIRALMADPKTGVFLSFVIPMSTAKKREQTYTAYIDAANEFNKIPVVLIAPTGLHEDELQKYKDAKIPVVQSTLDGMAIVKALMTTAEDTGEPREAKPQPDSIQKLIAEKHGALSEKESKDILAAYGTKMPKEFFVKSVEEAKVALEKLGGKAVLKACGAKISHKSDLKLVKVGINSDEMMQSEWDRMNAVIAGLDGVEADGFLVSEMIGGGVEVIFGVTKDDEFGHIGILGPGGILAEMMGPQVIARAPLPLSEETVRKMIAKTPIQKLANGYRGSEPLDVDALVGQVVAISDAVCSVGDAVAALDVNPISVMPKGQGAWPLDALFILK